MKKDKSLSERMDIAARQMGEIGEDADRAIAHLRSLMNAEVSPQRVREATLHEVWERLMKEGYADAASLVRRIP